MLKAIPVRPVVAIEIATEALASFWIRLFSMRNAANTTASGMRKTLRFALPISSIILPRRSENSELHRDIS